MTIDDLIDKAFRAGFNAGFDVTREGFNSECCYPHCSRESYSLSDDAEEAVKILEDKKLAIYKAMTEEEPKEPRATTCETCGHPLKPYDPNNTSTWREDNFCSARCKRQARRSYERYNMVY